MVKISGDRWRPSGIDAWFLVGDVIVAVSAEGTSKGVEVRQWQPFQLAPREARSLRERPSRSLLHRYGDAGIAPKADAWPQLDVPAVADTLAAATVMDYDLDPAGKVISISVGGGPFLPAEMLRRALAGPTGQRRTGPKSKVGVADTHRFYVETGSVAKTAEALGVSTATVYRRLKEKR